MFFITQWDLICSLGKNDKSNMNNRSHLEKNLHGAEVKSYSNTSKQSTPQSNFGGTSKDPVWHLMHITD